MLCQQPKLAKGIFHSLECHTLVVHPSPHAYSITGALAGLD